MEKERGFSSATFCVFDLVAGQGWIQIDVLLFLILFCHYWLEIYDLVNRLPEETVRKIEAGQINGDGMFWTSPPRNERGRSVWAWKWSGWLFVNCLQWRLFQLRHSIFTKLSIFGFHWGVVNALMPSRTARGWCISICNQIQFSFSIVIYSFEKSF